MIDNATAAGYNISGREVRGRLALKVVNAYPPGHLS